MRAHRRFAGEVPQLLRVGPVVVQFFPAVAIPDVVQPLVETRDHVAAGIGKSGADVDALLQLGCHVAMHRQRGSPGR